MNIIWVMVIITLKTPLWGATSVDGEALSYKSAELCLKDRDRVEKILHKYFDKVYTDCREKEVREK